VLHPWLGIDDEQVPRRIEAECGEVEIALRIDGAEQPEHKADGKRRDQGGTGHALNSRSHFHAPARRPAMSQ
jgi:hypothetical protein